MLNRSKALLVIVVLLTAAIYMYWPNPREVKLSPEVEMAINSRAPLPDNTPNEVYHYFNNVTLGKWNHLSMECAFPATWRDGYISRNNLKTKTSVLKKSDAAPVK